DSYHTWSVLTKTSIGHEYAESASSISTSIGFDFNFDGIDYKNFVANSNGFIILQAPTFTGSVPELYVSTFLSGTSSLADNRNIAPTITENSVLICPWFDEIRCTGNVVEEVFPSVETRRRIHEGLQPPPINYDE